MNKAKLILGNERGGAHIYILGLFAVAAMVFIFVISINVELEMTFRSSAKDYLDIATHAASLDIDPTQASYGNIVWDTAAGTSSFYKYLQLTLKLDSNNQPQTGSFLQSAPIIHYLGFVTNATYPYTYTKAITAYGGSSKQTTRTIQATLYGPSVVAIVEIDQPMLGESDTEPIIVPSVSNVRNRY